METFLPTTKHRRGRRTPRQARALADPGESLLTLASLHTDPLITGSGPVVLDIGFGSGEAVIPLAEADPGTAILAVDMHTPGIGDLLASLSERDVRNVRVIDADVRHVIAAVPPQGLAGVRTYFPDPWPKKRHHRRRLVTADFAHALAGCVVTGGTWHLATDWDDYALSIEESLSKSRAWVGGRIARPDWRPMTKYERRGIAAGRQPIDLWFVRVPG